MTVLEGFVVKIVHSGHQAQGVEQNAMNATFQSGAMEIQVYVLKMCMGLMVDPAVMVVTTVGRNVIIVKYSVSRFGARKPRM